VIRCSSLLARQKAAGGHGQRRRRRAGSGLSAGADKASAAAEGAPEGNDVTDYWKAGGDLREWAKAFTHITANREDETNWRDDVTTAASIRLIPQIRCHIQASPPPLYYLNTKKRHYCGTGGIGKRKDKTNCRNDVTTAASIRFIPRIGCHISGGDPSLRSNSSVSSSRTS